MAASLLLRAARRRELASPLGSVRPLFLSSSLRLRDSSYGWCSSLVAGNLAVCFLIREEELERGAGIVDLMGFNVVVDFTRGR